MADLAIHHDAGRDLTLSGWRCRQDHFTVMLSGRLYKATCGAVWDRAVNNDWRLDALRREVERTGDSRSYNAGQKVKRWVSVPPSQKAWRVIEDALIAHRKEHGYGQRPAPKETA